MHLWILVCQPIMLGFLLIQYHNIKETEAIEERPRSISNWFNIIEKKFNGVMHHVFKNLKASTSELLPHHHSHSYPRERELIRYAENPSYSDELAINEYLKSKEVKKINEKSDETTSIDQSEEKLLLGGNSEVNIVPEQDEELHQLQKKAMRMYKRRHGKDTTKKPLLVQKFRKAAMKKPIKTKKPTTPAPVNTTELGETTRKDKPVDIIVHIKMNDSR